ncbi:type II toxin-antitoxin system VapC family toxin [Methylococcus sp. EFPC2]|uniref:type II toxin-antitoxin system VapC family toxin n=1 Tax=Methylococcus sp. EFPC2 TaxID=2812648 RepID=UPI001966D1A0|nr:type II toxin-antitoxin system VapC family toxin [Methylococcus sp. EFPC2]QSA96796.1 type II toxin-antitoxin system VapC family toxin [Methylococcus sp. EFPC2]
MRHLVIDASVILKWLLPPESEPYQAQALAIAQALSQGRVEARLPALWYFEVGNILARKYRQDADRDLADLRRQLAGCDEPVAPSWQREIVRLTASYPVTFYDAAYHALAIVRDGVFVTADEKYLQAVAGEPCIMHLKDWY